MSNYTNDQYIALDSLSRWYNKYSKQVIEISGIVGTGISDVIKDFISLSPLDGRDVMYLSYDQKEVLELAFKGYHAYYIDSVIYKYSKHTNLDTLPIINPNSTGIESKWLRERRKKIDKRYKLIIVFDSILLSAQTLKDLMSFGIPIILIRDPMLLPDANSCTFTRNAEINLREISPDLSTSPIVYFAHKIINNTKPKYGNYDCVSVISSKQMNFHNFKTSDMNITMSTDIAADINKAYRDKILNIHTINTCVNERLILTSPMYGEKIKNNTNDKVRVYLRKGSIVNISRINRHALMTRYVPCDVLLDGYHESFTDLYLDRFHLNGITNNSRQEVPSDILLTKYAYALTPADARVSHWDKVVVLLDQVLDDEINVRKAYTAVTRASKSLVLVI